MKRLDSALVEWGLAPSRSKAQAMIAAGEIEIEKDGAWVAVTDNSFNAARVTREQVRLGHGAQTLKYVSRGGLKIESACRHLGLDPAGWRCLDLGLSTGGFSDYLLQHGASAVLGLDVGHGQLHPRLALESRLTSLEGVNAKEIGSLPAVQEWLKLGVDLCVIDLSFISLTQVLPAVAGALPAGARVLALVKPQFEAGRQTVTPELFDDVRSRVLHAADKCGFSAMEYFPSTVKGQDGSQEFFLWCRRR